MNTNWIKIILINLIVFLLLLLFILMGFEIYLKNNPGKFHSYGWVTNNEIKEITQECLEKEGKTGVFGDSFVEYYRGSDNNIANILGQHEKLGPTCNYGLSGTGLDAYFARYSYAVENAKISKAIIFFYEGNDYFEVTPSAKIKEVTEYDRKDNIFFSELKKSSALNFIWRQGIKSILRSEVKFEERTYSDCDKPNISYANEQLRALKENSPTEYAKFASNQLNVSWLQVALNCPNYFEKISEKVDKYNSKYKTVAEYIDRFVAIANKSNLSLTIVIIPHDYFVSDKAKLNWDSIFRFHHVDHIGPTDMTKMLMANYSVISYAQNLEHSDFIKLDGHLTPMGNQKLAEYVLDIIRN